MLALGLVRARGASAMRSRLSPYRRRAAVMVDPRGSYGATSLLLPVRRLLRPRVVARFGSSRKVAPTIASGSIRQKIATNAGGVTTNNRSSCRTFDRTKVALKGVWVEYFNGWVNPNVGTGIYADSVQEMGVGNAVTFKVDILTNLNGIAYDQSAATLFSFPFTNVAAGTSGYIKKLDNSASPPTFVSRSFAQFQADGGSVSGTTIVIPDAYYIRSDNGPDLAAGDAYALQIEGTRPSLNMSVTSITQTAGLATATVASTSSLQNGVWYNINGSTNGYNGAVPITIISSTQFTFPIASGTASPATGTMVLQYLRPYYNQAQTARGDIFKTGTVDALVGTKNWSSVSGALTTNTTLIDGVISVQGLSQGGKRAVAIYGDSIAERVGDYNQNNPSGAYYVGDGDGALGFAARALNAAGYSFIKVAAFGTKADHVRVWSDANVRMWAARNCPVAMMLWGHNDATAIGTYSAFGTAITSVNAMLRANGHTRLVGCSYFPTTANGTSGNWAARSGQTQVSPFIQSTGYIFQNFLPDLRGGSLTAANGWWDAYIDTMAICSDLDGVGETGTWPATGTAYGYTPDGTHPGPVAAAGVANDNRMGPAALASAFGFAA